MTTTETATHNPCCSSHGEALDCETYRRTHFVEVGPCCSVWAEEHPEYGTATEPKAPKSTAVTATTGAITNPIPGHDPMWESGECTGCETAACGGHDNFLICDNCGEDYPCSTVLSVIAELERQAQPFKFWTEVGEKAPNQAAMRMIKLIVEKLEARVAELRGESR